MKDDEDYTNTKMMCPTKKVLLLLLAATHLASARQPWINPSDRARYAIVPSDIEAEEGSRVRLPCRTAQVETQVQWTKDAFGMGNDRELRAWDRFSMVGKDACEFGLGQPWLIGNCSLDFSLLIGVVPNESPNSLTPFPSSQSVISGICLQSALRAR